MRTTPLRRARERVERTRDAPGRVFVALSRTNYRALSPDHAELFGGVWGGEVELLDRRAERSRARALAALVLRSGRYDAVVLDGSIGFRRAYVDLLAAALIGRRRRAPVVVLADCTWKRGSWWLDRLACRLGIRLVDNSSIHYCVGSSGEVDLFPRTWRVERERVSVAHWPYVLRCEELRPVPEEDFVFAGGDSLRDYGPLVEAVRDLPADVVVATSRPEDIRTGTLPNLRVQSVSKADYVDLLRRARVVVVPLAESAERSAGQTTYVNAMALGKLVIATDTLGVRDYVDDRRTGLVVPPADPGALRGALEWAVDPANRSEADRIAARARESALERFSPDNYVVELLRVARRALERRGLR